jgi:hypothetical protein
MEKYGFIYIWFDRKHKRYYIGAHWGTETDGYICSSDWMRHAYKRRKIDFSRRVIYRCNNKEDLWNEEYKWLCLIDPKKLGKKYYNHAIIKYEMGYGVFSEERNNKISVAHKGRKKAPFTDEHKKNLSNSHLGKEGFWTGKIRSEETKQNISKNRKDKSAGDKHHMYGKQHTNETKLKMSQSKKESGFNPSHQLQKFYDEGTIWITNGFEHKRVKNNLIIPDGWFQGMIKNRRKKVVDKPEEIG